MLTARVDVAKEFTPITAYFFAKLNNLLNEHELNQCLIAAKEYHLSTATPAEDDCSNYFRAASSSGCLLLNNRLSKIQSKSGAISSHKMLPYFEKKALESMVQFSYANLSELEKKQYCQDILKLINPYVAARKAKFKQFSEQVIQYIKDASVPNDKDEEDMVATFNNLTKNERAVLSQKIIQLVSVEGYKAYILSFFIDNASNERAKKFIDNNPSGEFKSARENVLGCTML